MILFILVFHDLFHLLFVGFGKDLFFFVAVFRFTTKYLMLFGAMINGCVNYQFVFHIPGDICQLLILRD